MNSDADLLDAKYRDEWEWWDRFLEDHICPWHRGERSIQYFDDISACNPPRSGEPHQAVLDFRQTVNHFLFEVSWRISPDLNYGTILDIGCGPFVASSDLWGTTYGVDPNLPAYKNMGYPVDAYGAILLPCAAEDLWILPSNFFDTILSNNALNHVNDFEATIAQMERVAKPDSFWRIETHYREPTLAEPLLLSDERILAAFHRFTPTKLYERHWPGVIASVGWTIGDPPTC